MSTVESNGDWEVDRVCRKFRALPREDRLAALNHLLNKPPKRITLKELLHRRALLVTELRTRGIWPA